MVKNKHKVILFTLEMETERILDRLFAIITKTENTFFKYKNISKENKYKCESYIAEHKDYIKIVDKSNLSEDEIIRICRQEKNKN
jgi:replicative DNA helicase